MFGGCEKVWFPQSVLSAAEALKEWAMVGKSGMEMGVVLGELPTLGIELDA